MRSRRLLVLGIVAAMVTVIAVPASATFTPGFYKNKGAELWNDASDGIVTGTFGCAGSVFVSGDLYPYGGGTYYEIVDKSNASDMTYQLARHTISAQLNLAFGACNAVWGDPMSYLVGKANTFLAANSLGTDPQGADRAYADSLKTCLDLHNNIPDGWTYEIYKASSAYACNLALGGPTV